MLNQGTFFKNCKWEKYFFKLYVYSPLSVKLLTGLRLQSKFKHDFSDTINPMRPYRTEIETIEYFLWQCHFYSAQRSEHLINLRKLTQIF